MLRLASKDTVRRMKRQVTEWEKIFVICTYNKEMYLEYVKNSCTSIAKDKPPNDKIVRRLGQILQRRS